VRLYNTLTGRVEAFTPWEPPLVRMYTCGPTVYRYAHIGNLRSYLMADWLRRALEAQGYRVLHIKNITDVGHMRQERLEQGEDKVIAAALAEGKTPQEIAEFYTRAFLEDEARLNILPAHHYPRASEHIPQMQDLIARLLEKGLAYRVGGNVYYAVSRFPEYGKLSGNRGKALLTGVRVEVDSLKRDPRDFALWKEAEPGRTLRWPSPWGEGFPGWHIECSAMAVHYLGPHLDLHTGGVDNIFPHHEAEIAQCEPLFGAPFVRHWVHGQHLLADGVKMAKSMANDWTLRDLEARGFDPLAFRYLCLTVHYRRRLNFTFSGLRSAQRALQRLRDRVWEWSTAPRPRGEYAIPAERWRRAFWTQVNEDLHLPRALAVVWEMVRSDLPPALKRDLLLEFDRVLGLALDRVPGEYRVPGEVVAQVEQHLELRRHRLYEEADALRARLWAEGWRVEDTPTGARVRPLARWERLKPPWPLLSSSREVPLRWGEPDAFPFTLAVVATATPLEDLRRCLEALEPWAEEAEVLVVDNGGDEATARWLEAWAGQEPARRRVLHTDHPLGEAAARNIALRQARGRVLVLMDPSVEALGPFLPALASALEDHEVGMAGPWGLCTEDLHRFHPAQGEVHALEGYLLALRRRDLPRFGLMREGFRDCHCRSPDLDFSFQVRSAGFRLRALPHLPLHRHPPHAGPALAPGALEDLSRRNLRRFRRRWRRRPT